MKDLGYLDAGLEGKEDEVAGTQLAANRSTLFSDLPAEVLLNIFSHLTTKQLLEQRKVSKLHYSLAIYIIFKERFDNDAQVFKFKFLKNLCSKKSWESFYNTFIHDSMDEKLFWTRVFYNTLKDHHYCFESKELACIFIMRLEDDTSKLLNTTVHDKLQQKLQGIKDSRNPLDKLSGLKQFIKQYLLVFETSKTNLIAELCNKIPGAARYFIKYRTLFSQLDLISIIKNYLVDKLKNEYYSRLKSSLHIARAIQHIQTFERDKLDLLNSQCVLYSENRSSWGEICVILLESIPKAWRQYILLDMFSGIEKDIDNSLVLYTVDIYILMYFISGSDKSYFLSCARILSKNRVYSVYDGGLNSEKFYDLLEMLSSKQLDDIAIRLRANIENVELTNYTGFLVAYLISHDRVKDTKSIMMKIHHNIKSHKPNIHLILALLKNSNQDDIKYFLDNMVSLIDEYREIIGFSELIDYISISNEVIYDNYKKILAANFNVTTYLASGAPSSLVEQGDAKILINIEGVVLHPWLTLLLSRVEGRSCDEDFSVDLDSDAVICQLIENMRLIKAKNSRIIWRNFIINIVHYTDSYWRDNDYVNDADYLKAYLLLSHISRLLDQDIIHLILNHIFAALDKYHGYFVGESVHLIARNILINFIRFYDSNLSNKPLENTTLSRCFSYLFEYLRAECNLIKLGLLYGFSNAFYACKSISHLMTFMPDDYKGEYLENIIILLKVIASNDPELKSDPTELKAKIMQLTVIIMNNYKYLNHHSYEKLAKIFFTQMIFQEGESNNNINKDMVTMLVYGFENNMLSIVAFEGRIYKLIDFDLVDSNIFFRYILLARLTPYFSDSLLHNFLMKMPLMLQFPDDLSDEVREARKITILKLPQSIRRVIPNEVLVSLILFILKSTSGILYDWSILNNQLYYDILIDMLYRVILSNETADLIRAELSKIIIPHSDEPSIKNLNISYTWNRLQLDLIIARKISRPFKYDAEFITMLVDGVNLLRIPQSYYCISITVACEIFQYLNLVHSQLSIKNWDSLVYYFIECLKKDYIQVGKHGSKFTNSQVHPQLISLFCKNKACLEVLLGHLEQEQLAGRDDVFSLKLIFMTALNTSLESNLTLPDDGYASQPALSV